jgi:hypothetical protein
MDANQKKFLLELYKISNGSHTTMVNIHNIQEQTKLEFPEINIILTILKKSHLIDHSAMGDMVAITHKGIDVSQQLISGVE